MRSLGGGIARAFAWNMEVAMKPRSLSIVAGLALLLWVVPSIGTQGMGTIGQQMVHADGALIDVAPSPHGQARALLARADAAAETALGL